MELLLDITKRATKYRETCWQGFKLIGVLKVIEILLFINRSKNSIVRKLALMIVKHTAHDILDVLLQFLPKDKVDGAYCIFWMFHYHSEKEVIQRRKKAIGSYRFEFELQALLCIYSYFLFDRTDILDKFFLHL